MRMLRNAGPVAWIPARSVKNQLSTVPMNAWSCERAPLRAAWSTQDSRGVLPCSRNRDGLDDQDTEMSPNLLGTTPRAQRRPSGCGLMLHVAYPGSTGVTPSTCSVSCTVGDAPQPWARLAVARLTPPELFLNSHRPPVYSGSAGSTI